MTRVLNIIPPVQGGVWDFAHLLASALGPGSSVLASAGLDGLPPADYSRACMLLHYSGYGFEPRGVPLHLLAQLRRQRSRFARVGVFFHEMYAFGPPWSSAFWLSPVQRYIVQQLSQLCDFWIANCDLYGVQLRRFTGKSGRVLQISSTIGESLEFPEPRRRQLVVFGSAAVRRATYSAALEELSAWIRAERIELHDVGPELPAGVERERLRAIGPVEHGRLDPDALCSLLRESAYGLLSYRSDVIGKSSVFAAYCAHGVCPVLVTRQAVTMDGVQSSLNFFSGIGAARAAGEEGRARVARAAWDWYQQHRLSCHADIVRGLGTA